MKKIREKCQKIWAKKKKKFKKFFNVGQRKQKNVQRVYPVLQPRAQVSLKRGSRLGLLRSTFDTNNFICRLFWFNSSDISAIHFWSGSHIPKSQNRKSIKPLFCCSRSSKVITFGTKRKCVYDFLLAINRGLVILALSHIVFEIRRLWVLAVQK